MILRFFCERELVALVHGGAWALLIAQALSGCGQTVEVGVDDALAASGNTQGGEAASAGAGAAGASACTVTACRGNTYACGNCLDDDADGVADAFDAECLGPCDDDELALQTGLQGGNAAACRQDCYFDGDAGPGNDQCEWSHACDPLSVAPDYPPAGEARCAYDPQGQGPTLDCAVVIEVQPAACLEACLPLVPNGCDCFGCCEVPARSGEFRFVGGGGASLPSCTPVRGCMNPCESCEACVGSGPEPACGQSSACSGGAPACDPATACAIGDYCVTGCCVTAPEPR